MAELILTDEDKAIKQLQDLPDDVAGKILKYQICEWQKESEYAKENTAKAMHLFAGLVWYAWMMETANSEQSTISIKNLTHQGFPMGDYKIVVTKEGYVDWEPTFWDRITGPFRRLMGKGPRRIKTQW